MKRIILACLIGCCFFMFTGCGKESYDHNHENDSSQEEVIVEDGEVIQTQTEITVPAGIDDLDLHPSDFLSIDPVFNEDVQIDYSQLDCSTAGEYKVTANYEGEEYILDVSVRDFDAERTSDPSKIQQTTDMIFLEAGSALDIKGSDFLNIDPELDSKVKIDMSSVDTSKPGEYELIAEYDNKKYVLTVYVDLLLNITTTNDRVYYTNNIAGINYLDFIKSTGDATDIEVCYVSYNKIAELNELTDEFVERMENVTIEYLDTSLYKNDIPVDEGIYHVAYTIKGKPSTANTMLEIYVVYDKSL